MKVKRALIIDAVVLLVLAVGCFFDMKWVHNMLGIFHAPESVFYCQLLGAAVFGLALQNWLVRKIDNLERLRIILLANFVGHGAAFLIILANKLNGAGNITAWLAVGYTLLATLMFGYFLDQPRLQSQKQHA
jgi:carbon starvation protein CstA